MFVLRVRDGNYLKRRPTARALHWTVDCEREVCPTILASGIRNSHVSGHEIEFTTETESELKKSLDLPFSDKPPYRVPLMAEIAEIPWNGLTAVSTFAGCGGSSTGYRLAGYRVLLANEFVPIAQESYRANAAPHTIVDGTDIRQLTAEAILGQVKLRRGDLNVLDGSPPCQAFSTAGKREKGWGTEIEYAHGAKQKNEELFTDFIRIMAGLEPEVAVAENVTGLVKGAAKGMFKEILAALKVCGPGYTVEVRKLDAQWLGVPQARERIIFVCVRRDLAEMGLAPAFPHPLPYRYSVREALPWIGRVVHDTRGSFQSGGYLNERPSVTIMSSAFDAHHFQVHPDGSDVEFDTKGTGTPKGPIAIADRPSPTIGTTSQAQFKVNQPTIKIGHGGSASARGKALEVDSPSPTIMAGGGRTGVKTQLYREEEGKVQEPQLRYTSNSRQNTRDKGVSLDDQSPTIMARRANVDVEEHVVYDCRRPGKRAKIVTDTASPTILASEPKHGGSATHLQVVQVENPGAGFRTTTRKGRRTGHAGVTAADLELKDGERVVGIGGRGGFGNVVMSSPGEPAATIGTDPQSGNGRNPPGAMYVESAKGVTRRRFEILEVKRLCGFPDDFVLKGTYGQQWERLGNSVPPPMMMHIAAAIRDKILLPAAAARRKAKRRAPARR